jgi:hypothetical protein
MNILHTRNISFTPTKTLWALHSFLFSKPTSMYQMYGERPKLAQLHHHSHLIYPSSKCGSAVVISTSMDDFHLFQFQLTRCILAATPQRVPFFFLLLLLHLSHISYIVCATLQCKGGECKGASPSPHNSSIQTVYIVVT